MSCKIFLDPYWPEGKNSTDGFPLVIFKNISGKAKLMQFFYRLRQLDKREKQGSFHYLSHFKRST